MAMKYVEFLRRGGDYLEFGVYRGDSFLAAYRAASEYRLDHMRFFAFDSFEGLPAPQKTGRASPFRAGDFSSSRHHFDRRLDRARVVHHKIEVVPGWYSDTLTTTLKRDRGLTAAAIVWVDCDLYESTVSVLDFVTDIIVDGGVIVFRDWYCYGGDPGAGEQRAVVEWLERHRELELIPYRPLSWNGESFIVRRPP